MCYAGGLAYAVPLGSIQELLPYQDGTRLPAAPAWYASVVNLRGVMVPAIAFAQWLNPTESTRDTQLMLVLHGEGIPFGLLVSSATEILCATAADIRPLPDMTNQPDFFQGVIQARLADCSAAVVVIDPCRLQAALGLAPAGVAELGRTLVA